MAASLMIKRFCITHVYYATISSDDIVDDSVAFVLSGANEEGGCRGLLFLAGRWLGVGSPAGAVNL